MANEWRFSIGNLATRSPAAPAAVAPAAEDTGYPLANLADGYSDALGGLQWRSDGAYDVAFDVNLLADSSERADAPTGWADLLLYLAGTPGLPANAPSWGDYASRNPALRFYGPVFQDVDVMPGENVQLNVGLYRPSGAAGSTATRVRVVNLATGKGWNGTAWASGGVLATQATADAWSDVQEEIEADASVTGRTMYRVIVEPVAATFDATTYGYASLYSGAGAPALIPEVDLVGIVGHNIPDGATVALGSISMTPAADRFFATDTAAYVQTWTLSIDMPTGNEPRPLIGEVWIGKVRTLLGGSPVLPIQITEGDPEQVRIVTESGRIEVLGTGTPPRSTMLLDFVFEHAEYVQARDEVARLTRNGEEPILLIPTASLEGAERLYHGRLGTQVAYSRIAPGADPTTEAIRSFGWEFEESPLAGA